MIIAAPDPQLQAQFKGRPAMLRLPQSESESTITPHFVVFPLPRDTSYEARFQVAWTDSLRALFQRNPSQRTTLSIHRSGEAGTPRSYALRQDDMIVSILLFSIFLMVGIVLHAWRFLRDTLKDFFRHRHRANLFTDREDTVFRGRWFTLLQTSFLLSILHFEAIRLFLPDQFEALSPYLLLGGSLVLFLSYYFFKIILYRWVNATFFPPNLRKQWFDYWFVSVLSTGTLLSPITLIVVFFDLPVESIIWSGILLIGIIKSLLLYKTKHIFFGSLLGTLHTILYFCSVEIAPLFGLWLALHHGLHFLGQLL